MGKHYGGLVAGCALLAALVWTETVEAGSPRWSASGLLCLPDYGYSLGANMADTLVERVLGGAALTSSGMESDTSLVSMFCAVPKGTELVELNNDNSHLLDFVQVRYRENDGPSGEDFGFTLLAHDYDSLDYCVCDMDMFETSGSIASALTRLHLDGDADTLGCDTNCNGGAVPDTWLLKVQVWLDNAVVGGSAPNRIDVLYINAFDT